MEYISCREAANKWGISQRRVSILCAEDRIKGASTCGNMWLIPKNAEKPQDGRSKKEIKRIVAKPFVKWAGGKSQLLPEIQKHYKALDSETTKFCEPFVGGGAVLFDILSNSQFDEVLINDINTDLIIAYRVVKDNVENLIETLSLYQKEFWELELEARKNYYAEKRNRFNEKVSDEVEAAALLIFLNKTCFNGLYRVNSKGQFNVPIGSYKMPTICDRENLLACSEILQNVKIRNCSYENVEDFIDENTLVYIDPPYRPITKTASFTSYTGLGFNDNDQIKLGEFCIKISKIGAKLIISNSDPKNEDKDDMFFDELYKTFKINRVSAKRCINSNATARGNINELLICSFYMDKDKEKTIMIKDGKGGANTQTGLVFEGKTDLSTFLSQQKGYTIKDSYVYYNGEEVARVLKKNQFYTFLEELKIDWKQIISKKLLPDDSIYVIVNNTLHIIECKFQQVAGSVDEKLQTCDFKKKQYQKLMSRANIEVEYIYLLCDWFKKDCYKDVLDYIISVRCQFYFEYIPLQKLGLPVPQIDEE